MIVVVLASCIHSVQPYGRTFVGFVSALVFACRRAMLAPYVVRVYDHPQGGGLYVGNWEAAFDEAWLRDHTVALIVNCSDVDAENLHVCQYFWLNMNFVGANRNEGMTMRLPERVEEASALIEQAFAVGQSVLYHCMAAAHRSVAFGTLAIANRTNVPSFGAAHYSIVARRWSDPNGRHAKSVKQSWGCAKALWYHLQPELSILLGPREHICS